MLLRKLIWQIYAPIYDSLLVLMPYTTYLKQCGDVLGVHHHETLLDVGCGTANLLLPISDGTVVAMDSSTAMLRLAKIKRFVINRLRRSNQTVDFIKADATMILPFADNSFDCVASLSMIHSVGNPIASVEEMVRVLKPGGRILLTVPLPTTTKAIVQEHIGRASLLRLLLTILLLPILLGVLAINVLQESWNTRGIYYFLKTEDLVSIALKSGLAIVRSETCFSGTYTLLLATKPTKIEADKRMD